MYDPDEPLAKDLLKAGDLALPRPAGAALVDALERRLHRRPAGNGARLWRRVAGEDPLADVAPASEEVLSRKTVYVDGRFVRLGADGGVPARAATPARVAPPTDRDDAPLPPGLRGAPTATSPAPEPRGEDLIPPGFRNLPSARPAAPKATADPPRGEDLIPPGFRNLPSARPTASRDDAPRGEDLIPPGFRNLPTARPPETPRAPRPIERPAPPPLPERDAAGTGRIRQRRVLQDPRAPAPAPPVARPPPPAPRPEPPPSPAVSAPAASAPPAAPPRQEDTPADPSGPPPGGTASLDDLFGAAPAEGRARVGRRRPGPTTPGDG